MNATPEIAQNEQAMLWRLYMQANPKEATALYTRFKQAQNQALDDNVGRLNFYFLVFCCLYALEPMAFVGELGREKQQDLQTLQRPSLVDLRRLFIGCMVKIYRPHYLTYATVKDDGFYQKLRCISGIANSNLSRAADEARGWYDKGLYSFREQVDETTSKLLAARDEGSCKRKTDSNTAG